MEAAQIRQLVVYREILDVSDSNPFDTVWVANTRGASLEYFHRKDSLVARLEEPGLGLVNRDLVLATLASPKEYDHDGKRRRMVPLEPTEYDLLFNELSAALPRLRRQFTVL